MADMTTPAAPVASAQSPKAQAASAPPVVDVKPTTPTTAPAGDAQEVLARAAAAEAKAAAERRKAIAERTQLHNQRKELGAKLSRLSELEKQAAKFEGYKLNPEAMFREVFGDDWYSKATELKVTGVPPAQIVANEVAKVREEFEKKWTERDEATKKASVEAQAAEQAQTRKQFRLEAQGFAATAINERPALKSLGNAAAIGNAIAQRVEQEWLRSAEGLDEDAKAVLKPISFAEAAEKVEADILGLAEQVAAEVRYQERLRAKLSPAQMQATKVPVESQTQRSESQRKTLSNDLTSSTPGRAPLNASTDDPLERAKAAYRAVRASRSQA